MKPSRTSGYVRGGFFVRLYTNLYNVVHYIVVSTNIIYTKYI